MKKLLYIFLLLQVDLSEAADYNPLSMREQLTIAVRRGDENIFKMIMEHPRFEEIKSVYLGEALKTSAFYSREKIVKMIMDNLRFEELQEKQLKDALDEARRWSKNDIAEILEDGYQKYAEPSKVKNLILGK